MMVARFHAKRMLLVGIFAYTCITMATGSSTWGVLSIGILFIVGFLLMWKVPDLE